MTQETAFLAALQGVGRDRATWCDAPTPGPQRRHRRRPGAARDPRAVGEPERRPAESECERCAQCLGFGVGLRVTDCEPDSGADTDADSGPDGHAGSHRHAGTDRDSGTDRPAAAVPATAGDLQRHRRRPGQPSRTIKYPASWFTVAAPPTLACRYFDPAADHRPGRPGDADDRGHDQGRPRPRRTATR